MNKLNVEGGSKSQIRKGLKSVPEDRNKGQLEL